MSRYRGKRLGSTLDRFDFVGLPVVLVVAVVAIDEAPDAVDIVALVAVLLKTEVTVVLAPILEDVWPPINDDRPI